MLSTSLNVAIAQQLYESVGRGRPDSLVDGYSLGFALGLRPEMQLPGLERLPVHYVFKEGGRWQSYGEPVREGPCGPSVYAARLFRVKTGNELLDLLRFADDLGINEMIDGRFLATEGSAALIPDGYWGPSEREKLFAEAPRAPRLRGVVSLFDGLPERMDAIEALLPPHLPLASLVEGVIPPLFEHEPSAEEIDRALRELAHAWH